MRKAIYPGSFDPITIGHIDIIKRLAPHFDELTVLVSISPSKSEMFSVEERKDLIRQSLKGHANVKVDSHQGLTVDFCRKTGAKVIIRGLRAVVDFEYETSMANINRKLAPDIETILAFASPEFYFISSRGVKEVAVNGGALTGLVPDFVAEALQKKIQAKRS